MLVPQVDECACGPAESAHPAAITAMQQIYDAENGGLALVAAKAFAIDYGSKFLKAVAKIVDELDVLLGVLQLPGRALGAPADDESDRVDVWDRPAPHQSDERPPGSRKARLRSSEVLGLAVRDVDIGGLAAGSTGLAVIFRPRAGPNFRDRSAEGQIKAMSHEHHGSVVLS